MPARRNVLIVKGQLKQYVKPFFERLYVNLANRGIALTVVYSAPNSTEAIKADTVELPMAFGKKVPAYWLFGDRVIAQPIFRLATEADLVIVDQQVKQVALYPLLLLSRLRLKKLAFWGHGYNRQVGTHGFSEWWKRKLLDKVDWWFAYTDSVARYLILEGVPDRRITTFNNTIDTEELAKAIDALDSQQLIAAREKLGLAQNAHVGILCGSLYPERNLAFLIEAAKEIRRHDPRFELVIVGDGPDRGLAQQAARHFRFVHYVGARFGQERAVYFAMSDVFLITGPLGLGIVDAFTAGLPVLTLDIPTHGPEIEYLVPGTNGTMSKPKIESYAQDVIAILGDAPKLSLMRGSARKTASELTLPKMVERFADGIERCLAS